MLEGPSSFSFEICVGNTFHATNGITIISQNVSFVAVMTAIDSRACLDLDSTLMNYSGVDLKQALLNHLQHFYHISVTTLLLMLN